MKRPLIRKSLRRLAIALGVVAVAVLLLVLWLVSIHKLCSEDGEQHWCVVRKSIFEHVMRNQRMAVHATDAEGHSVEMITRIVARPGDTVEINGGFVYVNGKAINEPSKAKCSFVISQHASFKLLHQLERIADGQTLSACDTIRFQLDEIKPEWKRLFARDVCILHRKEYVNEPTRNLDYLERAQRARGTMTDRELAYYCRELLVHGHPEKTVAAYRELVGRTRDNFCCYHSLIFAVKAWMQMEQFDVCAQEIVKALETVEPTAYMYCQLGLCYEKLGRAEDAEAAYRLATVTPERPETFCIQFAGYTDYFPALRMTKLCRMAGRYAEAVEWNALARKAYPQGLDWKWDAILLRGKSDST